MIRLYVVEAGQHSLADLLEADCRTLEQLALVDRACHFVEMAPG